MLDIVAGVADRGHAAAANTGPVDEGVGRIMISGTPLLRR